MPGFTQGAEGPPRTPPPRKGDPLEDMDTVVCHFEESGEGTTRGGGLAAGSWGAGHDYATYSPGGSEGVGYGMGGEKGKEGKGNWIEEEAAAFEKVVKERDPGAPCPKCLSQDHNVCSTGLRHVVDDACIVNDGLALFVQPPCL